MGAAQVADSGGASIWCTALFAAEDGERQLRVEPVTVKLKHERAAFALVELAAAHPQIVTVPRGI